MREVSLLKFLSRYVEEDYAMDVLYYCVKKTFIENNFSLTGVSSFCVDGRFLGDSVTVHTHANFRTEKHAVAFLLSLRILMLNKHYIELCENDSLILKSKPSESFRWVGYVSMILDNWDDDDVKNLYLMLEECFYDEQLSATDKEYLQQSLVNPGYKNEKKYYQSISKTVAGVSDNIIGDYAFVDADLEEYVVHDGIDYVGNTAFAYCENLKRITFKGKVLFGVFPIVECNKLECITVPTSLVEYYRQELPLYYEIIFDEEELSKKNDCRQSQKNNAHNIEKTDNGDIKSVECYSAINEDSLNSLGLCKEIMLKRKPEMDFQKIEKVFDNKVTSYKYFWFMSIISLVKEENAFVISYKDIIIRVVSLAWPVIYGYKIKLARMDMLPKYLEEIRNITGLMAIASSKKVEGYLKKYYTSKKLDKILSPLLKNVPFRFLSPWIPFSTNKDVMEKSKSDDFTGLYALHDDAIIINEYWWEYIRANYSEICEFIKLSFVAYVKQYNENVSSIEL